MDRIISKEEEREDPRRDSSIYLRIQWCFHILQELQCFHTQSNKFPVIPCYSTYRINSSTRNTTTTRLIPCRLLPATAPCVSKHSTRQNKAPGLLTGTPGPYSTSRLPAILPGRNSILSGSQHPRSPYSSSQAHSYRILPGETGFFPKGLSIVCPYNTKVSVFQFICYKNINSIQSSSNSMRRYSTLSSIQVILVTILHKSQ